MPGRNLRTIALTTVTVVAGVALLSSCQRATEIGEVKNHEVRIDRDGAASVTLGGKVFWAFGDTFSDGGGVRSSGAYADPKAPTRLKDTLVGRRPHQLVPFTAEEAADNARGDGTQWVIWPSEMVATSSDRALIFSTKFHATPAGWVDGSLVISEITAGSTQSRRIAEPLSGPGGSFAAAVYLRGTNVYLHDCGGANVAPELLDRLGAVLPVGGVGSGNVSPGRCKLARVPLAKVADASAYRYWNGAAWLASQTAAVGVVPGTTSGMSVAWSSKLGKYVSLSTPGFSKEIQMSTAPRPEGPWTTPKTVFTAETGIYATRIHPNLSAPDLSTMGVTYFRQDQPGKPGGVVLMDLTLGAG